MQIEFTETMEAELLHVLEVAEMEEFHTGVRPSDALTRVADAFRDALRDAEMDAATKLPTEWWEIFPAEHEEAQAAFWASEEPPEEWIPELWDPLPAEETALLAAEEPPPRTPEPDGFVMPF